MLGKRRREAGLRVLGMGSKNRTMPTKEETGGTGVDGEGGGSIEVGHPGGMSKGHLGPEVQRKISKVKPPVFCFHSFLE